MTIRILLLAVFVWLPQIARSQGAEGQLPTPGFHHLHLNSVNPDAAIDFYTRHFPQP